MTGDRGAVSFDPLAIIEVLNRHEVPFLVIGGIAAGVQGAMWATFDLDITYGRSGADLKKLAEALTELEAMPIGFADGVQIHLDERGLVHGDIWTLTTRHGRLDLLAEPAPGLRYETLEPRARTIEGEQTYRVAGIADLIAMKRFANRPQDEGHIRLLRAAWEASTEPEGASLRRHRRLAR
ncbi:MAG TPA: hypothetical protein VGQ64_00630 [Candidatus Limnocylindrales bacterium]|nr:hypothetical protein [Candidatus Limnocylindrales bacterium]